MKYFDLLSFQHIVLMIFGGVATALVIILACYSDVFVFPKRKERTESLHHFPGGMVEGRYPVPLVIVLLIAMIALWAVVYVVMAVMKGFRI